MRRESRLTVDVHLFCFYAGRGGLVLDLGSHAWEE
jgi:hypothetical protein